MTTKPASVPVSDGSESVSNVGLSAELQTPLDQADALLGDVISLVILAASVDNDPRFRALLTDQRHVLRAVRSTLGVINAC